ncbi:MAG: N-acetylmuramoyl-L-alanine amidase [Eubacterium sp.]|nr:N-acetylmuramoyl-L-alanine amidase [Eubacterium sp.]
MDNNYNNYNNNKGGNNIPTGGYNGNFQPNGSPNYGQPGGAGNNGNGGNNKNKKNVKLLVVIFSLLFVILAGIIVWVILASGSESAPTATPTPTPTEVPEETPEPTPTESPTPSPEPTPEKTAVPTNGFKVAIDAGHQAKGNHNTEPNGPGSSVKKMKVSDGTAGVSTRVDESVLNLSIAKKLRKILKKRGYEVYMIRTSQDVNISNKERAEAANDSGADICIRIHADGIEDSSVRGCSVLYPTEDNEYVGYLSDDCKKLAKCVLNAYCEKTGFANRGLSGRNDMTGFNWSEIPVALIELGFMSNAAEDEQMQVPGFQKMMATGIANGIDRYFGL